MVRSLQPRIRAARSDGCSDLALALTLDCQGKRGFCLVQFVGFHQTKAPEAQDANPFRTHISRLNEAIEAKDRKGIPELRGKYGLATSADTISLYLLPKLENHGAAC